MAKQPKKAVNARLDNSGNVTAIRFEGNSNFTSLKKSIDLAKKNAVDLVVVKPKNGKEHVRTRPNPETCDNLDELGKK